jgi:hypothetical protein
LNVEAMEDRTVPSRTSLLVTPDLPPDLVGQLGHRRHLFIPKPGQFQLNLSVLEKLAHGLQVSVPDLAGVRFRLEPLTDPSAPPSELDIQTQTYNADGSASFTGTWSDPYTPTPTPTAVFNARLAYDGTPGGIHITFSYSPYDPQYSVRFDGHINSPGVLWHIGGYLSNVPDYLAGNQIVRFPWQAFAVANLANLTFAQ